MPNTYYPFQPLQQQSPREFYFYTTPITPPPEPQDGGDYFSCKPPDYDTGSYIRVLSRPMAPTNTKSALTIAIDQDDKATFNRGDCITGRLFIRPTQDIPFEKLLIDLQVAETIVRGEICEKASFTKSTSIARHRVQDEAYPDDRVFRKGLEYSFTFSFVIPHTICEESATGLPSQLPLHYQLPPSVGTHSETGDHTADVNDRSLVISYRIRARVTKPGTQLNASRNPKDLYQAQQYKYLRVMPSYPAIRLAPMLYEGTRNVKHGILKRPTKHKLHFALAQPPVFYLAEGIAPTVSLQLAFEIDATTMQPQMPPPQVKNVAYKLSALTTSTTSPRQYYPHHDDPQVHTAKDTFSSQVAPFSRPEWRLEYNNKTGRPMYICTLTSPLALPSDKRKLVPNYFTELSSRQYEITMSVELNGYSPASFTFPAVIARARKIASLFWPSEEDAATDPVPTYSYYEQTDQPCPYDVKLEFGRDYSRRVNVDSSPLPSPQPIRPQPMGQSSWKITA